MNREPYGCRISGATGVCGDDDNPRMRPLSKSMPSVSFEHLARLRGTDIEPVDDMEGGDDGDA